MPRPSNPISVHPTVAIIQARMQSTRLPGKVLTDLAGKPVLEWVLRAASAIPGIDKVVVATSVAAADDALAAWCAERDVACVRGSEPDVLSRFADAARAHGAGVVLRITADCPFLDPAVAGMVIRLLEVTGADYASNVDPATWPDGLDCEAFRVEALFEAERQAIRPSEREHVTPFLRHNRARFKVEALVNPLPLGEAQRWTLDTPADLEFLRAVAAKLPADRPPGHLEILRLLDGEPELVRLRAAARRNDGFARSVAAESMVTNGHSTSTSMLERVRKLIPIGSQTFSKSYLQYPHGAAPMFLTHGEGGRVWDVDGNEYVDMVNGLLPVVLGYRDQDVDGAIRRQLCQGISFSLATALEEELALLLRDILPCAEQARFGKNGSDATSAAIRLARAFTGRERVITCGYHGWQDWYIGATARSKGVPAAVRGLTRSVAYNDLDVMEKAFREHPGDVACVIMEPMNVTDPAPGYLAGVKEICHRNGALLVFDEIITGFRFDLGGAQTLFGVTPDLAAVGKSMANGMPISAIVGRADVMAEMEQVFVSGTFGGEALSLAAAIATIHKMRSEPVIARLWETGAHLATEARKLIAKHGLEKVIALNGKAPWMLIAYNDHEAASKDAIKTLFLTEMLARGVLFLASHNISYAHDDNDMAVVLAAWDGALGSVAGELRNGSLLERLRSPVIESIFKVR